MTLYRVGSMLVENRRELCLIKNISAGGMMVRLYCSVAEGTPVTIELKSGQPIHGCVSWVNDQQAGVAFDQPVDVIDILSASMSGANSLRVKVCDISQGGVKVACETIIPRGVDVVISLPGIEPQRAIACWVEGGFIGIAFNRLVPLGELVGWLQGQRESQRSAG